MATEVIMPALGVAQETGRIVEWMHQEGAQVSAGDPLFEIETDKVTVAIEAPASGTLSGLRAREGEDVPVGQVVALILSPGEAPPEDGSPDRAGDPLTGSAAPAEAAPAPAPQGGTTAGAGGRRPSSPLARRRAREAGIDLSTVAGTGPGGAVTAADLEAAASSGDGARAGQRKPSRGSAHPEAIVTPGPVWQRMAERVTASWTAAPHFYLFRDVDAGRLVTWRASLDQQITLTDLLVVLVARALRRHPEANARWDDGRIVRWSEVNVGIAVALDDGLVVPVVRGADELGPHELADRRTELVGRARAGTLRREDVADGTFTVSNLGMYGVDAFAAVINAPQAAILSVGRVTDRVVALDGHPAVRPGMSLSLSCDHRALDGARAAAFLDDLAALMEEPLGLMT